MIVLSDSHEAHQLYQYAQTAESSLFKKPIEEVKGQSIFGDDGADGSTLPLLFVLTF